MPITMALFVVFDQELYHFWYPSVKRQLERFDLIPRKGKNPDGKNNRLRLRGGELTIYSHSSPRERTIAQTTRKSLRSLPVVSYLSFYEHLLPVYSKQKDILLLKALFRRVFPKLMVHYKWKTSIRLYIRDYTTVNNLFLWRQN